MCGYPPFYSDHGLAISPGMKKRIRTGQYSFPDLEWQKVSDAAKKLINGMLNVDPVKRLTINDVIHNSWIAVSFLYIFNKTFITAFCGFKRVSYFRSYLYYFKIL